VYAVVNIRITDPDRYAEYIEQAPPTIAHYGGKYLALGWFRDRGRTPASTAGKPLPYGAQEGKAWCVSPFRNNLSRPTIMPLSTALRLLRDAQVWIPSSTNFGEFPFYYVG
jgi:Domain of unknown function (DUF1330)